MVNIWQIFLTQGEEGEGAFLDIYGSKNVQKCLRNIRTLPYGTVGLNNFEAISGCTRGTGIFV